MQRVNPEVLEHLECIIEYLYTDELRRSFLEADASELVNHVYGSVLRLDRWLSDQKIRQRLKPV